MRTPTDGRPIPTLVNDAIDDVKAILAHERALAQAEVRAAAIKAGIAAGLLAAATSLLSLTPIFLIVTVAEVFAEAGLSRWAAYLSTTGIVLLLAVLLAVIGVLVIRRISPPKRVVATTRETLTRTLAQLKTLGRPRGGDVPAAGS